MILYFTGTGNSRYCAKVLADGLKDECMDVFSYIRKGTAAELVSEKPWIFVAPTYSWQLPHVFRDFIRRSNFSGSRDVYFVMTCGGEIGAAAQGNQVLCAEKELDYRGTLQVVMPENYIVLFNAPEQEEAEKIIGAAMPVLEKGLACIREDLDFPVIKERIVDKLKSGIVNAAFYRFIIKAKAFKVSDSCIGCDKCEKFCPLGNIHIENGKPVWGEHCTHCMACICSCPTRAIEYGKASEGKTRYQCQEYKG